MYSRVVISAYLLDMRVSVVEICEIMPRLLLENRLYDLLLNIIIPDGHVPMPVLQC